MQKTMGPAQARMRMQPRPQRPNAQQLQMPPRMLQQRPLRPRTRLQTPLLTLLQRRPTRRRSAGTSGSAWSPVPSPSPVPALFPCRVPALAPAAPLVPVQHSIRWTAGAAAARTRSAPQLPRSQPPRRCPTQPTHRRRPAAAAAGQNHPQTASTMTGSSSVLGRSPSQPRCLPLRRPSPVPATAAPCR